MTRKILTAVLALALLASAGLTVREATRDEPAVVKPAVSAEGRYRVGTVGDDDAVAAVKAAVAALPVALSYDYRSLDRSETAATRRMTPSFAKEFRKTFDKTTRALATEKQAITSSLVQGAGIVGTPRRGKATVLIYLDQLLVHSKAKKSTDPIKASQNRVRVSMREVGGHWLVDDIEPF